MNTEAINKAMAELDGWEYHPSSADGIFEWRREDREWFRSPPNYTEDLNAVALVVGKMSVSQNSNYKWNMIDKIGDSMAFDATALQRCEAILRACGKWVEE